MGKFNNTLGTLTGAKLDIFGAARTSISLTNSAATPQRVKATSLVDLNWTSGLAS